MKTSKEFNARSYQSKTCIPTVTKNEIKMTNAPFGTPKHNRTKSFHLCHELLIL